MNTLPLSQDSELTPIKSTDLMSAYAYAGNERVLRRRDAVLSWLYNSGVDAIWSKYGTALPRSSCDSSSNFLSSGTKYINGLPNGSAVQYADYASTPIDAYGTDVELFGRDSYLYYGLIQVFNRLEITPENAEVPASSPGYDFVSSTWDTANPVKNDYHEPHPDLPLLPSFFTDTQRDLASYDDDLYTKLITVYNYGTGLNTFRLANSFYFNGTVYAAVSTGERYKTYFGLSSFDRVYYDSIFSSSTLGSVSITGTGSNDISAKVSRYSTPLLSNNSITALNVQLSLSNYQFSVGTAGSTVGFLCALTKTLIVDPLSNTERSASLTGGHALHWVTTRLNPGRAYTLTFTCDASGDASYPVSISVGVSTFVTTLANGVATITTPVIYTDDPIPIVLAYSGNGSLTVTSLKIVDYSPNESEDISFFLLLPSGATVTTVVTASTDKAFVLSFNGMESGQCVLKHNCAHFLDLFLYQEQSVELSFNTGLGLVQSWLDDQAQAEVDKASAIALQAGVVDYQAWLTASGMTLIKAGPVDIGRIGAIPAFSYVKDGLFYIDGSAKVKPSLVTLTPELLQAGMMIFPPSFWRS